MKVKYQQKQRVSSRKVKDFSVKVPGDYAWKALSALAGDLDHLLNDSEKATLHAVVRKRDFAAYKALSSEWGPQSIPSHQYASLAEMRAKYQVVSLLKKFQFPSDSQKRRAAAVEKFTAAELACEEFNRTGYIGLVAPEEEWVVDAFTYTRAFLQKLLGHELPGSENLTSWSRHGPGANLDTKFGRNSLYFKYKDWPYSCTRGASGEARDAITSDERWLGALEDSYRERYNVPKHELLNQEVFWSTVINIVDGNRISFVPKSSDTDRTIAIEPSLNLYLQLGIDGFIRRRLKRWGVDLDNQAKNQELARIGSRDWEERDCFCTLDLAAASDTISVGICKLLLPRLWFNHLMKLRSPVGDLGGETIAYAKISSMGNGFTFALESAIFTAVVYGVTKAIRGRFCREEFAVYGDDIIVRKTLYPYVTSFLERCGFALNHEKSFSEGPFRESCGADWFRGSPVRPVFLATQPTSVMELWTDINRLRRILSLRFLVDESKLESVLVKWIPEKFRRYIGPCSDEQFDSYLHREFPVERQREGMWWYHSLRASARALPGRHFLFRKLMHDLRNYPDPVPQYTSYRTKYCGLEITGGGSRFTVTRPYAVTVSQQHSASSYWRSEYEEILPWASAHVR